jgi:hypothetical protein
VLLSLVSSLVAIISPFWGLIFLTVNICDFLRKDSKQLNAQFAIFGAASIVLFFAMQVGIVKFADSFIGVGLALFIFANLYKSIGFAKSLSIFTLFEFGYGVARKYLFNDYFIEMFNVYKNEISINEDIIKSYPNFQQDIGKITDFYMNNIIPIWTIPLMLAVIAGMIVSRKNPLLKFQSISFKVPNNLVYLLMVALVLAIFKDTRVIGLPMTVTLFTLIAIQGFPIVWFWLLGSTYNNTLLRILTYIIILINFHIFICISGVVGIIDIWFNLKNGVQK